jgi:DNA polymerase-3 subunit gamma/tau
MTNNSKVLALKYRPQNFNDIIGQEVITETIKNSLKADKIPNAYLFTGIRGVGKTTIARIVAKSLNCSNGFENSCKEKCSNCDAITNSNHLDILEMDAASKTSVDDVRDLIEFSRYGPTTAKYKIFIIDEVHMLSKQAFNALLKTLEEPPEYLKFIFATTEIKKVPITVVSRCQRFDLSRIKSSELFEFIKKVKDKENGKISDDALKFIVKLSEGSVRDALSLLDKALLSIDKDKELDLKSAQKIFGYFDKSNLIEIFEALLKGDQSKTLEIYRSIYEQGVDPKIFINDFLEILYYFKNIEAISQESKNFDLNTEEFQSIKNLSKKVNTETIILFWHFTIKVLDELDIVADQNISIEMFLIRLMHIKSLKTNEQSSKLETNIENKIKTNNPIKNKDKIKQIKNIIQEKKLNPPKIEVDKVKDEPKLVNLDDLIELCQIKRELQLKYELETNVNLVKFEYGRIEISFNEKLEKNFIKNLTVKLLEWTNKRWIISLSKKEGNKTIRESKVDFKKKNFEDAKKTEIYEKVIESFPDAELTEVKKDD